MVFGKVEQNPGQDTSGFRLEGMNCISLQGTILFITRRLSDLRWPNPLSPSSSRYGLKPSGMLELNARLGKVARQLRLEEACATDLRGLTRRGRMLVWMYDLNWRR